MKAIAKVRPAPGLDLVEVDEPQVRPGHVKVRIEHGSVCGTDLHIYSWDPWAAGRMKPPTIVGHEFCGTIVEVGAGVSERAVGDFVASESHIVTGPSKQFDQGNLHVCPTTRILGVDTDGGFAAYAVIPWQNARLVPTQVPRSVASMMDALGNGVHTVMDGPVEGLTVLVTGMGPIGLFAVAICKALGAHKVIATEVSDYRIRMAEAVGADVILNPKTEDVSAALRKIAPEGVDATLEMSGHPSSLSLALEHTTPGGRVSLLGVYPDEVHELDVNKLIFKGLRVHGIVGRRLWETWDQMNWLLTEKGLDVTPVITHQMDFREVAGAMDLMKSGQAGKIVLDFSGAE